jgi:hypothetical protein
LLAYSSCRSSASPSSSRSSIWSAAPGTKPPACCAVSAPPASRWRFTRAARPIPPAYAVYLAGCRELTFHLLGTTEIDDTFSSRLAEADRISPVAMNSVRSAMEREVGEQALRLEDRMTVLATAVSGAPFLGLLGTVWGVMDTFSGIAIANHASLAAMAPGVSGALITTVTGLLVAIPAMFGYNYLDHRYLDTSIHAGH